jgi:hypothetical protein
MPPWQHKKDKGSRFGALAPVEQFGGGLGKQGHAVVVRPGDGAAMRALYQPCRREYSLGRSSEAPASATLMRISPTPVRTSATDANGSH